MELKSFFYRLVFRQLENVSIVAFLGTALLGVLAANLIWLIRERTAGKVVPASKKRVILGLIIYVCLVFHITFYSREAGSRGGVSMELNFGDYDGSSWSVMQMIYTLLNVCLFVPLGILLGMLRKEYAAFRRVVMCTVYAFLSSFLIELLQLVTKRGYFELTDIFTNSLGGLIGVLLISTVYGLVKLRGRRE